MSSLLDSVRSLVPYHLLSYGTLLGIQFYQSFINTKLCFRFLPPAQFRQLQTRIFPAYFRCQVGFLVLTAITHPPASVVSLVNDIAGLCALAVILVADTVNWLIVGPKTIQVMIERSNQEAQQGPESPTPKKKSDISRQFSRCHAMTIHLNAISIVATVFYGFQLATRLHL